MSADVKIEIVEENALEIDVDVLALKYAQKYYGVDDLVSTLLMRQGIDQSQMQPRPGEFRLVPGEPAISARNILFVGVVDLYDFGYREIRDFGRRFLSVLAHAAPQTRHVAATIHGAGYGLDEIEAFEAEIAGILDAIDSGDVPRPLRKISIVELDSSRVKRLQPLLGELYHQEPTLKTSGDPQRSTSDRLRNAGYASDAKSHVFVAMPFKNEMADTYHYGIQGAVRAAGLLCERADLSTFTGDVMHWVQQRIRTSALVIADLTEANPNVYLEVGYAWGCEVPVLLLTQSTDHLKFDVRGQRCLVYNSIRELEESLRIELENLCKGGPVV